MSTLKTYYVGLRFLWPVPRTMEPLAVLSPSARKACKAAIQQLNSRLENPLRKPMRYIPVRREDVAGGSIHQVRLSMHGRDSVIVAAALAAGVPEVNQEERK